MDEIQQTKTDIAVVKNTQEQFHNLFQKIDIAIDRLTDVAGSMNRVLAVHDARLEASENRAAVFEKLMEDRRNEIIVRFRELENTVDDMRDDIIELLEKTKGEVESTKTRISVLESWRWYVIGIATALGIILSRVPIVEKLFN